MTITIYTKPGCPFCIRAMALLDQKGAKYTQIEAFSNETVRAQMRERAHGRNTFPQIFINDIHIGGCDDLFARDQSGGLDVLLQQ